MQPWPYSGMFSRTWKSRCLFISRLSCHYVRVDSKNGSFLHEQYMKLTSPSDLSNMTSPSLSMQHSPTETLRRGSTRFTSTFTMDPMQGSLEEPPTEVRDLWSRRRKIDGALNRVPPQFFERTYCILQRMQGLRIGDHTLTTALTKEASFYDALFYVVETRHNLGIYQHSQIDVYLNIVFNLCTATLSD